jgi:hypothetical protein
MERIFFANTDSTGPVSMTSGAIAASQRAIGEMKRKLARGARFSVPLSASADRMASSYPHRSP